MMLSLFDVVALTQDLPDEGLAAGMIGTVVDVYAGPVTAYEIEFCDALGRTVGLLALLPEQLRLATGLERKDQPV